MKCTAVLFGGLMLLAASANAQDAFSFADIPIEKEATIEVDLGPEMLRILGDAAKAEDPQAGLALEGITSVRFRMYEDVDEDMPDVLRFVDATATRLQAGGWQAVVRIRDGSDLIRVYMKPGTAGKLAGVAFMMTSGDEGGGEAMFINVTGAFEPAQLGHLASINGITGAVGVLGIIPGADGGDDEDDDD